MLTPQQALIEYQKAKDALDEIVRSGGSTAAQKETASSARDDLTLNFIQANIDDVGARSVQFQEFITQMEQVINDIGKNSPLAGLNQLQGVVTQGKELLSIVHGSGGGTED